MWVNFHFMLIYSPTCSTCLFSWYRLLITVGGVGGDFSQTLLSLLSKMFFLAFLSLSILFSVFYIMFYVHICLCMLIDCHCNDCMLPFTCVANKTSPIIEKVLFTVRRLTMLMVFILSALIGWLHHRL